MALRLNAKTEQGVLNEVGRNHDQTADDVIHHALDALVGETPHSAIDPAELEAHLADSFAQAERGELYNGEQAREMLAARRARRVA